MQIDQSPARIGIRRCAGQICGIVDQIHRSSEILDEPVGSAAIEWIVVQIEIDAGEIELHPRGQRRGFVDHVDLVASEKDAFCLAGFGQFDRNLLEMIVIEIDREKTRQVREKFCRG